jgi:hypothetical protein
MKIFKSGYTQQGFSMNRHIEYGVFLQNVHGMYYFLQDGSMYGYLYNCVDTYNSPRAIEEIKRK